MFIMTYRSIENLNKVVSAKMFTL